MNTARKSLAYTTLQAIAVAALCTAACSSSHEDVAASDDEALAACTFKVKTNTYDGPNYWGTVSFTNGSKAVSGYAVDFDVPAGAHCTNDSVPSGATLSPLQGSGSSATTTGSHCTFTFKGSLAAGATKTFNYSTDSTSFHAASNVVVSSPTCGGSGSSGGSSSGGSSSGGSSSGGSSSGGSSSGGSSGSGSSSGGSSSGGGSDPCANANLTWKSANKTNFTSYPDPGSPECIQYNGCAYEGEFAACDGQKSKTWVSAHNIVSVFPDFNNLKLHDLCIKSGSKTMVVTVLDECADSDCSGCCTQNRGSAAELIDIESYTNDRFGVDDGRIEWADLGPTKTSGCN